MDCDGAAQRADAGCDIVRSGRAGVHRRCTPEKQKYALFFGRMDCDDENCDWAQVWVRVAYGRPLDGLQALPGERGDPRRR